MGRSSNRKWSKRRYRYATAKTVTERVKLRGLFGHCWRFWVTA